MRVTIISDDNTVVVDGKSQNINCSALAVQGVHAVQWDGTKGEIEYKSDADGHRAPNGVFDDLTPYQSFVDAWTVANIPPPPAPPAPPAPPSVLPQDLMAQFTADDATKIRAAVDTSAQFWLLWSAMQAQKDPMLVTNARFLAGWSALIQVIGADRMQAIATALGVTV